MIRQAALMRAAPLVALLICTGATGAWAQAPTPTQAPAVPAVPNPAPLPVPPPAPKAAAKAAAKAEAAAEAEGGAETALVLACKERALSILRQRSPSIEDLFVDMDGVTVAKADVSVGDTKIHTVIMGEAYIQRDQTDKVHRFLCLTGESGKVLMTFFTER